MTCFDVASATHFSPMSWAPPPPASLQVQQPELGDVLGAGVQAAEALLSPRREGVPADMPDTERVEQPGPQVLGEGHPRVALSGLTDRIK